MAQCLIEPRDNFIIIIIIIIIIIYSSFAPHFTLLYFTFNFTLPRVEPWSFCSCLLSCNNFSLLSEVVFLWHCIVFAIFFFIIACLLSKLCLSDSRLELNQVPMSYKTDDEWRATRRLEIPFLTDLFSKVNLGVMQRYRSQGFP